MESTGLLRFLPIIILTVVGGVGCSNQWREADPQISADEMWSMLDEVESAQGASGSSGSISEALQYKSEASTAIYFADAPGPLGPVASILSFTDFSFLGISQITSFRQIQAARVFFLDTPTEAGRHAGLVIGIQQGSDVQYVGFSGSASFSGSTYTATLNGPSGSVVLRSLDVQSGDLKPVIQLKVYVDTGGGERYIGKISTLVGFGS